MPVAHEDDALRACRATLEIQARLSSRIPLRIGVNSGEAYVGAVGTAEHVEFTALGDVVNTAARLATEARAGELLVPEETATKAGLAVAGLERRRLELRGKTFPTVVVVVRAS